MAEYSHVAANVHGAMGCDQKFYTSVEVTAAPVLVPTQWPLVLSFTSVVDWTKNFSLIPYAAAHIYGAMGCDQESFILVWW